jgi:hypothetical protein
MAPTAHSNVLQNLLSTITFSTSVASLQGLVSQKLLNVWDTAVVNGINTILLPKNINEVIKDNYLVKLYILCLEHMGYDAEVSADKEWSPKLKLDARTDQFLRAFGLVIVNDTIPELPSNHGLVWKGIASSLNIWLGGQEKVDRSLFKVQNAIHPAIQVFGDIWGKGYTYEKRMLDVCINFIRKKKLTGDLSKLLVPLNTIAHDKGLNLAWSADLISPIEDSLIRELLDIKKVSKEIILDTSTTKTIEDIKNLSEFIRNRQKSIKDIKDIIKSATSNRITAAYSPYQGKSRDKARKKPIKELISDLEGSIDYKAFNPSVFVKIIGVAPFTIVYPSTEEEWNKFDRNKEVFIESLVRSGLQESTANQLAQRVEQVVRLTRKTE